MPTLTQNHVRLVLVTVAVLGAAALTAILLQGRGTSTVPVALWSLLVGALAVCGVLLPLVAVATPLSSGMAAYSAAVSVSPVASEQP